MIPNEYHQLIDKLDQNTSRGKINWESTSDEDVFSATFGTNVVLICDYTYIDEYGESQNTVSLSLKTVLGDKIDNVYSSSVEGDDYYDKMKELFRAARHNALKIDKTINDILNELDKD